MAAAGAGGGAVLGLRSGGGSDLGAFWPMYDWRIGPKEERGGRARTPYAVRADASHVCVVMDVSIKMQWRSCMLVVGSADPIGLWKPPSVCTDLCIGPYHQNYLIPQDFAGWLRHC
jgi:hypothetical protein